MSKKKISGLDPFDVISGAADSTESPTFADLDMTTYGALEAVEVNRQKADPVKIREIEPDIAQPRRAVPHGVRKELGTPIDPRNIEPLFQQWIRLVEEERGRPFDLAAYLDQRDLDEDAHAETEPDRSEEVGPLETALVRLIELATSIRQTGLTNPITVVEITPMRYRIETGERRWLAYHLLYWHTADEQFGNIAARTVKSLDLWRQAAENNARTDLNAISRARQFAVLLMDLLKQERGLSFQAFSHFKHEQDYYAQVADPEANSDLRIPRGTSERLINATGLKSRKQLREYRSLLRLPTTVWDLADDLNWPERAIRDLVKESAGDDLRLIELAQQKAASEGYRGVSVSMGTVAANGMNHAKRKRPSKSSTDVPPAPGTPAYYSHFMKVMKKAKKGGSKSAAAREEARSLIHEFRRWLDEEERHIRDE